MKVLWFTNTPVSYFDETKPGRHVGSWQGALAKELSQVENLDLSIAFFTRGRFEEKILEKVKYFPISYARVGGKWGRLMDRIRGKLITPEACLNSMQSLIKRVSPDVIHIHGSEELLGLIQQRVSIPVVLSIQGIINSYVNKYYGSYSNCLIGKYSSINDQLKFTTFNDEYKIFQAMAVREREILSITKNIIGRTQYDYRICSLLAPQANYFHCEEILRPVFYHDQWNGSKRYDCFKVVTVISDNLYKGLDVVYRTLLSLPKELKIQWNVIGISEGSKTAAMARKRFGSLQVNKKLNYLGIRGAKEVKEELLSADLFIQTSYIENSPNSLAEAMILGVPIIATNVGGTASMLNFQSGGIMVQEGDPIQMASAIIWTINNKEQSIQYARQARELALNRHNKLSVVRQYLSCYNQVISSQNA